MLLVISILTLDESQVAVAPLNRQMSLDEAYVVLGVEGGAQDDDAAIMVAYNELVISIFVQFNGRAAFNQREPRNSRKQWKSLPIIETVFH